MRRSLGVLALIGFAGAASGASTPRAEQQPHFELPIACSLGSQCFVQNYVDHDPGPAARDYACGSLTYNGHTGTDFRIQDMAAEKKGVPVLAAAPGKVLRTRDGVQDILPSDLPAPIPSNRMCGNGLIIDHGGGWTTQYCHMAQGSLRVRPGQAVAAGDVLGMVGMSGEAEFPHLHFGVRRGVEDLDPFASGAAAGQCSGGVSLWSPKARAQLAYRTRSVLNAGFTGSEPTARDVEWARLAPPSRNGPLIAWVRAVGLKQGDLQSLVLTGPGGQVLVRSERPPLDHDKAQQLTWAGKRASPAVGWPRGRYHAQYRVTAGGKPVLSRDFDLDL